jgi:uncharacterized membrane protein
MVRADIVAGLRNAMARGVSLERAVQSFISSGYNESEVREAAQSLGGSSASSIVHPNAQYGDITRRPQQATQPPSVSRQQSPAQSQAPNQPRPPQAPNQPRPPQAPVQPQSQLQMATPQAQPPQAPYTKQLSDIRPRPELIGGGRGKKNIVLIVILILILLVLIGGLIFFIFKGQDFLASILQSASL